MESVKLERRTLLLGHTSPETAYLVDDYPYGFRLRCSIRYWIETAEKGAKKGQQRFVSQTTNPKRPGDPWNAPKGSTYAAMAWMYLDGNDHVQWTYVSDGYGLGPQQYDRYRLDGVYDQMPESDRRVYDVMVKMSQRYADPWESWAETVGLCVAHIQATGEPPAEDGGSVEFGGLWRYVGSGNYRLLLAVAYDQIERSGE